MVVLYSVIQLSGSQLAADSVKEELDETVKRYQNKVAQWESSQEALEQLTDDLQASQNLLRASRQKVECLQGLTGSLQQQVDTQLIFWSFYSHIFEISFAFCVIA